jgi:hypothetical protein
VTRMFQCLPYYVCESAVNYTRTSLLHKNSKGLTD